MTELVGLRYVRKVNNFGKEVSYEVLVILAWYVNDG